MPQLPFLKNITGEDRSSFYETVEPPLKNQFDVIITPHENVFQNLLSDPASALNFVQPLDAINPIKTIVQNEEISKFHVNKINVPLPSFEYVAIGNKKYVSDIIYPEEVSMSFIEDKKCSVSTYLSNWVDEVFQLNNLDYASMLTSTINAGATFINGGGSILDVDSFFAQKFQSDPGLAKKNAIIIPHANTGEAYKNWYLLKGLSIKSIETFEYAYGDGEMVAWNIVCSVDLTQMIKEPFTGVL